MSTSSEDPGRATVSVTQEVPRRLSPVLLRLVLFIALFAGVDVLANVITGAASAVPVLALVAGLLVALLAVLLYRWVMRAAEQREVRELARPGAAGALGRGTLFGLGLFVVTIGLIAVFGGYRSLTAGSFGGAVTITGVMAAAAVAEELLFRGVVFRLVERLTGTWGALAVSSALFGGLHLLNPSATLWGALAIAVEAGAMLGAAYVATRSLWLPIGLHFGWNLAEAGIFGTAVSGSGASTNGLLHSVLAGPAALTGGAFGPEASVFAILVAGVPVLLFLRLARRRGTILRRGQQTLVD